MTARGYDADVVVVGGGAVGSAAAWQLAARGVDVLLLERFAPGHTRGASHGASRIFRLSYPDRVHVELAREARELWRELEKVTETSLLEITGGVDHGAGPWLEELHAGLVEHGVAVERLDARQAEAIWPGIRIDGEALYHPETGRLHADRSVAALQQAARAAGAQIRHRRRVTRITVPDDDTVALHQAGGQVLLARRAVVAVGAWSAGLLAGLVPLPPLRVTREQPAHFVARGQLADWPAFGHHLGGRAGLVGSGHRSGARWDEISLRARSLVYGLATPGEGVKVGFHGAGPIVDPDQRHRSPRLELVRALRSYVQEWLPGLDADRGVTTTCTYTSTPDSTFVLDRQGPLVVAAGFSGHGFKFVPALGRVLADLAADGPHPDAGFRLERFTRAVTGALG